MQNSLNIQVCKFYQYLHVQCGYMWPYYNAHIQHCDLNQEHGNYIEFLRLVI